ncbi:MAG: glycine oxidase ThiO [Planctomycetota bacterium]
MAATRHTDVIVVGGGVVGLSVAYELARTGRSVRLLERTATGREASWAGAGILPPGSWFSDHPAVEALAAASRPLHRLWSHRLREQTGIDDELLESGALYAITPDNAATLDAKFQRWATLGLESRRIGAAAAAELAPQLRCGEAYFVPEESHVRNPRRLAALAAACRAAGVALEQDCPATEFDRSGGRVTSVLCGGGAFTADAICIAAGAWAGGLLSAVGLDAPTKPIRGQMLLLRQRGPTLRRVYHEGGHYLTPRRDGRVLVGSTVEDAGFDKSTRLEDLDALLHFAHRVAPSLREASIETSWAGLRPASPDGLPMIGRVPGLENAWVAAGHFRSGLQFAPATAVLLRQLMGGEPSDIDTTPFSPERFATAKA